jgi:hypothetical protein
MRSWPFGHCAAAAKREALWKNRQARPEVNALRFGVDKSVNRYLFRKSSAERGRCSVPD